MFFVTLWSRLTRATELEIDESAAGYRERERNHLGDLVVLEIQQILRRCHVETLCVRGSCLRKAEEDDFGDVVSSSSELGLQEMREGNKGDEDCEEGGKEEELKMVGHLPHSPNRLIFYPRKQVWNLDPGWKAWGTATYSNWAVSAHRTK